MTMKDPGTIYSDDELENYSEDDDEEENKRKIAVQNISMKSKKCDKFFEDLPDEKKSKSAISSIEKYLKIETNSYDLSETIERVRSQNKKQIIDDDGHGDYTSIDNGKDDEDLTPSDDGNDDEDFTPSDDENFTPSDDGNDDKDLTPSDDENDDEDNISIDNGNDDEDLPPVDNLNDEDLTSINNGNDDEDLIPLDNKNYSTKGTEILKLKGNMKIKEMKKKKIMKHMEEQMEKDKEQLQFEDAPPVNPDISFLEMNLSPQLLKAISAMGYNTPTPIQASTIPIALKGRDICGCAATGTGKTAAFMLPIVQRLIFKPSTESVTRVLVLVPTRELGIQVFEVARGICQFTNTTVSISVGGLNKNTQSEELLGHPDIIIATPGRLIDHLHNTPNFTLKNVEVLILDEADRMLDNFFIDQLKEIVRQCALTRQTMLFSATMTDKVKDLVEVSLKKPVRVFVNSNTQVAQNLQQEFIRLKQNNEEDRLAVLAHILNNNFNDQTLVFIQQKKDCCRMHIIFGLMGLRCGQLHGNLKQIKRTEYLEKFKNKEINILFATDVAARGLDIKGVKTVINYNVPNTYETYVHRVGRTARAGFSGRSVTISNSLGKDFKFLRQIQKNSLTPLYERIVSPNQIKFYVAKLKELEPSVQKVLQEQQKERKLADSLKNENENKKKKSRRRDTVLGQKQLKGEMSFEEIQKEKERLKKIISSAYLGEIEKIEDESVKGNKNNHKTKENKNNHKTKGNKKRFPQNKDRNRKIPQIKGRNLKIKGKNNKNDKRKREGNVKEKTRNSIFDKDLGFMPSKRRKMF